MRNHSYEIDFDLHENETACRTHFQVKGFALRLVLKQRHKRTRKWPIACMKKDRLTYHNLLLIEPANKLPFPKYSSRRISFAPSISGELVSQATGNCL